MNRNKGYFKSHVGVTGKINIDLENYVGNSSLVELYFCCFGKFRSWNVNFLRI